MFKEPIKLPEEEKNSLAFSCHGGEMADGIDPTTNTKTKLQIQETSQ